METKKHEILEMSAEEVNKFWKFGVFDMINRKYNLLIDTAETEIIPYEDLKGCLEIINSAGYKNTVLSDAIEKALEYKTLLEIDL